MQGGGWISKGRDDFAGYGMGIYAPQTANWRTVC